MQRCGKCTNCLKLEKVKNSVLACCGNPSPISGKIVHADDGVVEVWNDQLRNLPCTGGNDDNRDSTLQSL